MRKEYTNLSQSERYHRHVVSMQVISVEDDGTVTLLRRYKNGEMETTRMMCSFGTELTPARDFVDVEMYLTGSCTSYRILGLTPEEYIPQH